MRRIPAFIHVIATLALVGVGNRSVANGTDLTDFGIPTTNTDAVETTTPESLSNQVTYDGDPITVVLGVGKTTRVVFDFVGHVGVPPAIAGKLDVKTLPSGTFMTPQAPFDSHAIQVRNANNTRVIPVSLSAIASADPVYPTLAERIDVVDQTVFAPAAKAPVLAKSPESTLVIPPVVSETKTASVKETVANVIPQGSRRRNTGLIDFVRFLAQNQYGPRRLARNLAGVETLKVNTVDAVRLIPGARFETTPTASYRFKHYTGTVITIENLGDTEAAIDPRRFNGYWRYAVFLSHRSVIPPGETTTVFLISDRSFKHALRSVVWR